MTKEEIVDTFKKVLENYNIDVEKISNDTKMAEDLNIDSLDLVEIVMELEEKFKVTIPETKMADLKTFGLMVDYIEEQAKAN